MTGRNSIEFNEATMIEIVQYWLDNKFLNKDERSPTVMSVAWDASSGMFPVQLETKQPKAA
ncbi:MAG TPA: hypothetical protein VLC51_07300 [Nitrospira sp.]|nr:hypothetical protein [Nitrospira sp.]